MDVNYPNRPVDDLFVDSNKTPLTEAEACYYLNEAFTNIMGFSPSQNTLAILWAQSALETGRWSSLMNNNWGNIKKLKDTKYTSYKCSEVINGINEKFEPYHPQTFFAAWDSPLEGATAYINFVKNRKRYLDAWNSLIDGDPVKYVENLKKGGYFTALLEPYTKTVLSLFNEFNKKYPSLKKYEPPSKLVENAINAVKKMFKLFT